MIQSIQKYHQRGKTATVAKKVGKNSIFEKVSEHSIQVACINWFRYQYPRWLIYAIPNGGARNKIVAVKLKEEGVLSGVPDLHIPVAKKGYHGLYVEMKAGKNKATDKQIEVMQKLSNEGYKCEVCWSFDEFKILVDSYLK